MLLKVKPATPIGVILASLPYCYQPHLPHVLDRTECFTSECVPVARTVTTLMHFRQKTNWMEAFPAAMLLIINGTNNVYSSRSFF